jgi:hypothetical protein
MPNAKQWDERLWCWRDSSIKRLKHLFVRPEACQAEIDERIVPFQQDCFDVFWASEIDCRRAPSTIRSN